MGFQMGEDNMVMKGLEMDQYPWLNVANQSYDNQCSDTISVKLKKEIRSEIVYHIFIALKA